MHGQISGRAEFSALWINCATAKEMLEVVLHRAKSCLTRFALATVQHESSQPLSKASPELDYFWNSTG